MRPAKPLWTLMRAQQSMRARTASKSRPIAEDAIVIRVNNQRFAATGSNVFTSTGPETAFVRADAVIRP
jgi:hypothetical protein